MGREIVIDIESVNTAKKYDEKALFQKEALDMVVDILSSRDVKSEKNIVDCRFHDTIFVDGARGVGKTAFMLNIESYYTQQKEEKKYLFLNPVDPTLLEHTEKFLSIVLARVVERVSTEEKKGKIELEREYFKALAKLSKSLSAIKTISDDVGIEEIASNQSSLQLEQNAHSFFKIVSETFKVKAIVVLIDDIDMAFDKGFDVLEVVRKYLASPYIIPIVAGDMKLYREIIETQFMRKIDYKNDVEGYKATKNIFEGSCQESGNSAAWDNTTLVCDKKMLQTNREALLEKRRLVNNLVTQYINKVFPNEYHIKLEDMFSILKANTVKIKLSEDVTIPYKLLKEFEVKHINFGINPKPYQYPVFVNNTRSFMQNLYKKRDVYKKFFTKDTTEKTLDKEIVEKLFKENTQIYKNSIQKTALFYEYAEEPKQRELSQLLYNDVYAYENGKYNLYNAFKGEFFKHSKLDPEKENATYAVHYKSVSKLDSGEEQYIADLFIFNNYYKNDATKNYMFAGKFVEMLVYSLSIEWSHFKNKDSNCGEYYKELESILMVINQEKVVFKEIADSIPFNSVFLYNKRYENTQAATEKLEDNTEEVNIKYKHKDFRNMILKIGEWSENYVTDIKLNSLSLYEILHKFFNNLNRLKESNIKGMQPLEYMQRVVMIFLNAVAFFENINERVAETNVAVGKKFDLESALEQSMAWKRNIKPMKEKEGSLTKTLYEHPIIKYILDEKSNLSKLEFANQEDPFFTIYKKYFLSKDKWKSEEEEKKQAYKEEIMELFLSLSQEKQEEVLKLIKKSNPSVAYHTIKKYADIEQLIDA